MVSRSDRSGETRLRLDRVGRMLAKRMSEKWAKAAASRAVRSDRRLRSGAQFVYRCHGNSVRHPSLRAAGAIRCSTVRRGPASAPTRLNRMISPPGFDGVANFIEGRFRVGNGGDDVLCDNNIEEIVREISRSASITSSASTCWSLDPSTRSRALPSIASRCRRRRCGCGANNRATELPVPTPTSRMRPPIRSAASIEARRPRSNTGPNTRS